MIGNASVIFTIETVGPHIHLSTLTDGAVTANPVLNLAGTITDISGIMQFTINNETVTVNPNGSYSRAVTLVAGANPITMTAVDNGGNQTSVTRNITYDATAPQLTVTTPADGALTVSNIASVSGAIGAGVTSVNVKINGVLQAADISGSNFSTVVTLTSGMNTIEVIATDVAQHTNSIKRTVFFDVTKPGMAITLPVEDVLVTSDSVDISGVVDPAPLDAALKISTDNTTFMTPPTVTGSGTTHITFDNPITLPAGVLSVTLQVRDSADNLLAPHSATSSTAGGLSSLTKAHSSPSLQRLAWISATRSRFHAVQHQQHYCGLHGRIHSNQSLYLAIRQRKENRLCTF